VSNASKGFLITIGLWAALALFYIVLELAMGRVPFALFDLGGNGKFIVFTVLAVTAIGTGVGLASDRIQAQQRRR
jgi:hypothetical protein